MVIYKHNLAEKLFGFAYSKEFLRENTDLCPFVDDPNLSLDIDLAVEFHKALRSDPIAAEKVTNLLILSSSYIDVSTAEFYTDKMKTYPVFDDHINRINDLFDSLPDIPKKDPNSLPDDEREREEIGKYINEQLTTFPTVSGIAPTTPEGIPFPTPEKILYERVSLATGYTPQQLSDIAFNSNFNNALKNALEDCLNSPCNLFSETSDSIASLANQVSMMNSTTMPTWGELKNNFFNAIGGVPDTIFKKVPMSIKNSIIELGQIGQQAIEQSTEMFFAKPDPLDKEGKKSKENIIKKALAGQSLNTDSQGYKYLPDLDSYLNVTKMSSKILKKAADDLGGCFNKFQQAARYEPYNPEHNKSFTSKDPINNKRGDDSFSMNTTGKTNNDYKARTTTSMSSCSPSQVEPATGSGTSNAGEGADNSTSSSKDDLRGKTVSTNNVRLDNDGVTPPSFTDPYYQSQTSLPGLDATKDYFVVVPIGSKTPLGTKVIVTNPTTGKSVNAIVGDRGPAGASIGEVSFATARDLDVWSGKGDSVKSGSNLEFKFLD